MPHDEPSLEEIVLFYHERTKHHLHRFAAGPEAMDWANQPDPFRRYRGAPAVSLPLAPPPADALPYSKLHSGDEAIDPAPLTIATLSQFLRYSLSVTAWKELAGTRWALRANPSSGNLHPTEGYVVIPALDQVHGLPGVHHYAPREHALERRTQFSVDVWETLAGHDDGAWFLVGLSSVFWREAWKYGERAYRYCQHDAGHAMAALRIAATSLGWQARLLEQASDLEIARLLGIDRAEDYPDGAEREHPDLLLLVRCGRAPHRAGRAGSLDESAIREVGAGTWHGSANVLSPEHSHGWEVIDTVAEAVASDTLRLDRLDRGSPAADRDLGGFPSEEALFGTLAGSGSHTAERVILGRRSAVAMDGRTAIDAGTFFRMLARLIPGRGNARPPWDLIPWRPRIHLVLFAHRVTGLEPGLYALARDPEKVELMAGAVRDVCRWQKPAGCPDGLPLHLLTPGDCRELSRQISCHQSIAADGAFSLGMLAELTASVRDDGASAYRRLFWEAGMVGQVLYLEAEEAGVRGTGIGCYFDDVMHELLGLQDRTLQSLYHFTVGGAVEDERLTTLPAYG